MPERTSSYRTGLEVAVISVVIWFLVGAPGLPRSASNAPLAGTPDANVAPASTGQLVSPSRGLRCSSHQYETYTLSTHPLLIYVNGFLSKSEIAHLLSITQDKWIISTVSNAGVETVDDRVRKSEKAAIDRDEIVQCIEQRALSFQGWPAEHFIERLWLQRYNISGFYGLHYDWGTASKSSKRVSSFMVYLTDDCDGGGTNFPRLTAPTDPTWCEYVVCDTPVLESQGVTFKPRAGNAVFWMNFDHEGRGYKDTIHAGMPVTAGQKIGLNIWTWYQAGHKKE